MTRGAVPRVALLAAGLFACGRTGLRVAGSDGGASADTRVVRDAPAGETATGSLCSTDEACDDGLYCNGEERCVAGACAPGAPVSCEGPASCEPLRCDDELRACVSDGPGGAGEDADGDGHPARRVVGGSVCGTDCDDSNRDVHPGAREVCNGVDDDCDGATDEGAVYEPTDTDLRVSTETQRAVSGGALVSTGRALAALWGGYEGSSARLWAATITASHEVGVPAHALRFASRGSLGATLDWSQNRGTVVWTDARDGDYEAYLQPVDAEVAPVGTAQRLSAAVGVSYATSVRPRGGLDVAVWQDDRAAVGEGFYDLFAQRVERSTGRQVGNNVWLNMGRRPSRRTAPQLASAGPAGAPGVGLALTWLDSESMSDDTQLGAWFAVLDDDLRLIGPRLVTPSGRGASGATLLWLRDRWLLAWSMTGDGETTERVWARTLSPTGAPTSEPVALTPEGPSPRAWALQSMGDRLVLAWSYLPDSERSFRVFARTYGPDLVPRGEPLAVTRSPGHAVVTDIEPTPDGSLGVLYRDQRTGDWELRYTRLRCAIP